MSPRKYTTSFPIFLLLSGLLFSWSSQAIAQSPPDTSRSNFDLDFYLESIDGESRLDEEQLAALISLLERPKDINTATQADLAILPFLSPHQVNTILSFRDSTGGITDISHLATLPGFTQQEVLQLQAFFKTPVDKPNSKNTLSRPLKLSLTQSIGRRLDLPIGYQQIPAEGGFYGSPASVYSRLAAQWREQLSFRMILEKDPGETFSTRNQTSPFGIDHMMGFLQYKGRRWLDRVIIGDYTLNIGQGLLFWRNTARGKGTAPISDPLRGKPGPRPMASREEHAFFRGSTIVMQPVKPLLLRAFYSSRSLDATLVALHSDHNDTTKHASNASREMGALQFIRSIKKDGLHRTPAELARMQVLQETLFGGTLGLKYNTWKVELAGYHTQYGFPFLAPHEPYRHFDLAGNKLSGVSVAGSGNFHNFRIFTEAASSIPGGSAILVGIHSPLSDLIQTVIVWRHFDVDFRAPHGNAFSERKSSDGNESGFYLASKFWITPKWEASFFVDLYKHAWLKSNATTPSAGFELFCKMQYIPRKWLRLLGSYRLEHTQVDQHAYSLAGQITKSLIQKSRHHAQLSLVYIFSPHLKMRTRFDARHNSEFSGSSLGFLSYLDLTWTPNRNTTLHVRLALFDIDDGGPIMYAYENDLRYRFTIQAFTGTGARNFILLRKRLGTHFILEAKYSTTRYGRTVNKGSSADSFSGTMVRAFNTQITWII